ncbi:MAG TPA: hypothetical protein ENN06_10125 [Desulfobacteraceae bacterium]|nr:hypothetical protein [Desulfobacteraceae bacterium]
MGKKKRRLAVAVIFLICLYPSLAAAGGTAGASSDFGGLIPRGELIADEISRITGCAISPILGISVLGAYTYYATPAAQRDNVPWHAAPQFWAPLLIILFLIILKDSAKVAIPKIIMVPLDAVETLLEKNTSAVLALIVLLTSIGGGIDQAGSPGQAGGGLLVSAAHAAQETGAHSLTGVREMIEPAMISVLVITVFTVVWTVSQAFNFLILLSPFSTIDLLLTLWKNSIIALLLLACLVHPYAGLLFSLCVILLCLFLFSRSLRFVVFGSLTAMDLLRKKAGGLDPGTNVVKAFAGAGLGGVPSMSYGALANVNRVLRFTYRPWFVLPVRTCDVQEPPEAHHVGKGILSPVIVREGNKPGQYTTLCRLRPRYASREHMIAQILGLGGVRDLTFGRGVRDSLRRLRERLRPPRTVRPPDG